MACSICETLERNARGMVDPLVHDILRLLSSHDWIQYLCDDWRVCVRNERMVHTRFSYDIGIYSILPREQDCSQELRIANDGEERQVLRSGTRPQTRWDQVVDYDQAMSVAV